MYFREPEERESILYTVHMHACTVHEDVSPIYIVLSFQHKIIIYNKMRVCIGMDQKLIRCAHTHPKINNKYVHINRYIA